MGNFGIDTNEAKNVAARLEEIKKDLQRIRDGVQSERGNSAISNSSMEIIRETIDKVVGDIDNRSVSVQALSAALRNIADIYERAEKAVIVTAGRYVALIMSDKKDAVTEAFLSFLEGK